MKKYLLAILVILLLSAGVVVGLLLVQQNQIFQQKASTSAGTATVSISPATATFQRDEPQTISIFFNTANTSISGVAVSLSYSNLGVVASGIQINPELLSSGDWTCPVKSTSSVQSTGKVDIGCANTTIAGYSNSADVLLATFTLTASQVPLQNPLIVTFDPAQTIITAKATGSDIALTPSSTGSYTITDSIAQSPTATAVGIVTSPTPTATGNANATLTPTPTATTTAQPTATPTNNPNATLTPTPTAIQKAAGTNPPLPVSGIETPVIIGGAAGILLLLVGALLIL